MIDIVKLDNGLRIAYEQMPFLNSVSFGIWVKNGSRYENEQETGISHFIEHLLFKGTKKRTAKEIATEMDKIGGYINAFTSKEYTCYYAKTLNSHLNKAVDVLADMFFNSNFDEEEIKKELNVILEEISMYEDSPEDLCVETYHKEIFKGTTLAKPILGTKETISTFNQNTFKNYMNKKYIPENIVISVAGSFDKNEVTKLIKNYFSDFKSDVKENKEANSFISNYTPSYIETEKDIEQLHMILGFESFEVGSNLSHNVSILSAILGGGMSSRLFQKVREERGLCYSIYTQNLSYKGIGTYYIYSALNKSNAEQLYDVTMDEIKNIKQNILNKSLIEEKKEQVTCNYLLGLENSINRMNAIGRSVILHDKIYTKDEIIEKINNVNIETLETVIDKIFNMDKLSISITGNISGISFKNNIK